MAIKHRYRIVVKFDSRQSKWVNALTGKEFKFPAGVDLDIELAIAKNQTNFELWDISNLTDAELVIKSYSGSPPSPSDPAVTTPSAATIDDPDLTIADWESGASQHMTFSISAADSNIPAGTYWLTISGATATETLAIAWGDFDIEEDGTGPVTTVTPITLGYNANSIRGVNVDESADTPSDGDILVYRSAGSDYVLEQQSGGGGGDATSLQGTNIDASVGSPSDGDILVYRSAGSDFVLETKPTGAGATNLSWTAATSTVASDTGTDAVLTVVDGSNPGLMTSADKTKLDGVATSANNYSHPNHTGDVTSTGDGATVIANNVVTLAKMADMATASFIGRNTAATGDPEVLNASTARTILSLSTTDNVLFANLELGADGALTVDEHSSAPGTPASGKVVVYAKADGKLYIKDDVGTETDLTSTGSGSLGSNLSSTTDDITSNNGTIRLAGSGGTNNEDLDFDFETTANEVGVSSSTGVTKIDFGSIELKSANLELGVDGALTVDEHSGAPGTPASGKVVVYAKADGKLYIKDDVGTETDLTSGGGGDALTTDPLSQFAATTSAQLAGVISDETGTGVLVFGTSPTFTTGITVNGNIAVTGTVDGEDVAAVATTANSAIQPNDTAVLNAVELNASGYIEILAHGTSPTNPPANGLSLYVVGSELRSKDPGGTVKNLSSLIDNAIQEDSTGSQIQDLKVSTTSNLNGSVIFGDYQTASPPTPPSGTVVVFSKDDKLFIKDDGGNETDLTSTGSGSLGSNLSSTSDDITSDNGNIRLRGTGGTNNEDLYFDFETTANEVGVSSLSGVTTVDFGSINLDANNLSGTNTGDEPAASTTTPGIAELATSAEINTGTDNTRTITPSGLAGSNYKTTRTGVVREIYIDAAAMAPRTTNGAAAAIDEYATNDIISDHYLFDGITEEGVQFKVAMPDAWDRGTIKAKFFWDGATGATASDGVTWGIAAQARSNDDAIDNAFAASVDTDDALTAVGDLHVTAASAAITVSNTPAIGDIIWFEVTRVVGDTNDTMAEDAKLLGVQIQYTEGSTEPAAW